jgi:hypothetical protein
VALTALAPGLAQAPLFDGRGWTIGHQQRNSNESLTEYVLPGQTVENWRELVTSTVFFQPVPIARLVDEIHRLMSKDCPSLVWNMIRQDEKTAVFEWRDAGCGGDEPQTEIDRLTIEADGLFRLAYAVKTRAPLPPDRRTQWLAILDQVPLAEGRPPNQRTETARPVASPRTDKPTTLPAALKLSTAQMADAVQKSGWPCPAGVKSEVKGQTASPQGLLDVALLECSNGQRYSVLVGPSGVITAFPQPQ